MPFNPHQQFLLKTFLTFPFETLLEIPDKNDAIAAFKAVLDPSIPLSYKFDELGVSGVVGSLRNIFTHPAPQNRAYSDFERNNGYVSYWISREDVESYNPDRSITLKSGVIIRAQDVISQNRSNPNEKVLAREPVGLLSLSTHGPVTKAELIARIRLAVAEQIQYLEQKIGEDIEHKKATVAGLIFGLTDLENRKLAEESLATLRESYDAFKKDIFLELAGFFYDVPEYRPSENEAPSEYLHRVSDLVIKTIEKNLESHDAHQKAKEEVSHTIPKLREEVKELSNKLESIRQEALKTCWEKAPEGFTELDKNSQWSLLVTHESNYDHQKFPVKNFRPDKEKALHFLGIYLKQDKELERKKEELSYLGIVLRSGFLDEQSARRKKLQNMKANILECIAYLKRGEFQQALAKIPAEKGERHALLNAVDDSGRSALDYAFMHRNYLLALTLFKGGARKIAASWAQSALDEEMLEALSKQQIEQDIHKMMAGAKENDLLPGSSLSAPTSLAALKTYYAENCGYKSVYEGRKWACPLVDDLENKIFEATKIFFYRYVSGRMIDGVAKLDDFRRMFKVLGKDSEFKKMLESELGYAEFLLKDYWNGVGTAEVSDVRSRLRRLDQEHQFEDFRQRYVNHLKELLANHGANAATKLLNEESDVIELKNSFFRADARDAFNKIVIPHLKAYLEKHADILVQSSKDRDEFLQDNTLEKIKRLFESAGDTQSYQVILNQKLEALEARLLPIRQMQENLAKLAAEIEKVIASLKSSHTFLSPKLARAEELKKALENARPHMATFSSYDAFLDYSEGASPSIRQVLQKGTFKAVDENAKLWQDIQIFINSLPSNSSVASMTKK